MAFDWPNFLRQQRIEFVTKGPNTPRGEISVKCPLCGPADRSQHMCIALNGKGWHCWRNNTHKGKSRVRLIQLLLKCSVEMARDLAGVKTVYLPQDEDIGSDLRTKLLGEDMEPEVKAPPLRLLKEFKPLSDRGRFAQAFHEYLIEERHYRQKQIDWLVETYDLHYAVKGPFAYRVIIPLYDEQEKLQCWVGRSIIDEEPLRYKALSPVAKPHLGLPAAKCRPPETLLGLDVLTRCPDPRALIVTEGPFDAFRISVFGHALGVYGTCLFGLNLTEQQAVLLEGMRERFKYVGMLLDSAAHFQAFRLANNGIDLDLLKLEPTVKDPGELSADATIDLCLSVIS
jgi:hypothetical protein